jgi:hypothetical protein
MKVDDIEFVKALYPRLEVSDSLVEQYRGVLDLLPPIDVANDGVIVDGVHRWQAHLREGRTTIEVVHLGTLTDDEILDEAYDRNVAHGMALDEMAKRRQALRLWGSPQYAHMKDTERIDAIQDRLKCGRRTVETGTANARAAELEARKDRAWEMWTTEGRSQKDIAVELGVDEATISRWLQKRRAAQMQPPESRQTFSVWKVTDSGDRSYFGRMPPAIVENLFWLYTEPDGIVVDPFAGSGTTIKVAKEMGRRVWAYDRRGNHWAKHLPIGTHDITTGWPDSAPDQADLVLLDPPYWDQAKGRYSDDPADLGNMGLDEFNAAWDLVIKNCVAHVAGHLVFIISQTRLGDFTIVDHAWQMGRICEDHGLELVDRINVPYPTQQYNGAAVDWAKTNKQLLSGYRDLVVFKAATP